MCLCLMMVPSIFRPWRTSIEATTVAMYNLTFPIKAVTDLSFPCEFNHTVSFLMAFDVGIVFCVHKAVILACFCLIYLIRD